MTLDFSFLSPASAASYLLQGLYFSVALTLAATVGGISLGTLLALMRQSGPWWLAWPATAYVALMRSIPLVMVILWFFLLIPLLTGRPLGAEGSALVTFTLFEAAYFAEIVRAGLRSVAPGQLNAALALGLSSGQAFRWVLLPQAFRAMLPVLLTQTLVLFQDTSLVYAIGAYDLLKGFETAGRNFNRPVEAYLLAAAVYFVICGSLSLLVRRWQRRVAIVR